MNIRWIFAKAAKKILNPPALNRCSIARSSRVCSRSELTGVTMGPNSYIGNACFIVNTEIGAYCSVADNVGIGGATHPIERVSTSPVFHQGKNVMGKNLARFDEIPTSRTVIGNDVWIGRGALVKAGVTVHDGAVIGMGSVVTHDVGPYEIWAGNPARLIRKRFSEEMIDGLRKTEWWTWPEEKIRRYADVFDDPAAFLDRIDTTGETNK